MHINHSRGETREFVYRKNSRNKRYRRHVGRKGLVSAIYRATDRSFGPGGLSCPCCVPWGQLEGARSRYTSRLTRLYGKKLIEAADEE